MASSAVRASYYCHQCDSNITPNLENFTCPSCNTGFIEPISESETLENTDITLPIIFDDIVDSLFPEHDYEQYSGGIVVQRRRRGNPRRNRAGSQLFRFPRPAENYRNLFEPIDNVLNSGLFATLLNQQQLGVPPASQENVENLPRLTLTEELAQELQNCSICFDEFQKDCIAIKLNCTHVFHETCLIKWLKIHGTCPVCRKDLQGNDTTRYESRDNQNQASTSSDV